MNNKKGKEKKDSRGKKNREEVGEKFEERGKILAGGFQATTEPLLHCSYCAILPLQSVFLRIFACKAAKVLRVALSCRPPVERRAPKPLQSVRSPLWRTLFPCNQRVNSESTAPYGRTVAASERQLQGLAGA